MKTNIIKALFGLILTFSISGLYAQSPRIKLNQIVKDTISGSVLISNLSDSNMVYSRNFYIGSDSSLVFFGTTIVAGGGGGGSFVTLPQLTDSLALYATKVQLSDSMATVLKQVATDLTLTGDGTGASPLKVDTTTYIATKGDLNGKQDQLNGTGFVKATGTTISYDNSTYLTGNQTITLSGDVTGSGTTAITATVVDDSHNHIISNVDNLQDSLNSRMVTDFSNASGTLPVANGGTGSATLAGAGIVTGSGATNYLPKFTGSTTVGNSIIYDNGTNVGIGTTNPSTKLVVLGTTSNAGLEFDNGSTFTYIQSYDRVAAAHKDLYFYASGAPTMVLKNSTNVGIGTMGPTEKLEVNGKVKISDLTGTGGNAVYENGGVLGVASDARFKSHIADLDNGLEKILNLKPKYFIDNRNSTFQQLGFYAQEIKSVINEASYPIGNTEYYGINDRAIIAVTVKAIQEQQVIIKSQATEIETLKTQIQLILSEIEQLKNK